MVLFSIQIPLCLLYNIVRSIFLVVIEIVLILMLNKCKVLMLNKYDSHVKQILNKHPTYLFIGFIVWAFSFIPGWSNWISESAIGERMIGVQVLLLLSHVCVCSKPFSLWCWSIVFAPAIMACVLPQKSWNQCVHLGLPHDGKLQIVSSMSLVSIFTASVRPSSAEDGLIFIWSEGASSGE